MNKEKKGLRQKFQQKVWMWLLLISAGVVAYGLGLHQGSMFRMSRAVASNQKPVVAEIKPEDLGPVAPSGTPGNIESPKSHSK